MSWRLPPFRFSLRTLLLAVLVCAIGAWLYTNRPERLRAFRNQQARQRIDPYELSIAGDGNPRDVPPELVGVLGDSWLKHWNRLMGVKILAGDRVATWGYDAMVRFWDINTGHQTHQESGIGFAVSGDRKVAFLAATDGTIRSWNVTQPRVTKSLGLVQHPQVIGMAVNVDGSMVLTEANIRGTHREIIVWNTDEKSPHISFIVEKPGGGSLVISQDGRFFTWEISGQIQLSDSDTGERVRTFGPIMNGRSKSALGRVVFSADGKKIYVGSASHQVTVFDVATGEELERIGPATGSVRNFALNENEHSIVLGGQRSISVLMRLNGEWAHAGGEGNQHRFVRDVDWHGQRIAAADEYGVSLWANDLTGGVHPWHLQNGPTYAIHALAFHPAGRRLFTGNNAGQIAVWDVGTWKHMHTWQAHERSIASLAVSRDGSRLLSTADDHTVAVWDSASFRELTMIRDIHQHASAGITPDARQVVSHMRSKINANQLEVTYIAGGKPVLVGSITGQLTSRPVWSPDGKRVALTDGSRMLKIFRADDWTLETSTGRITRNVLPLTLDWFSDSQRLLTAGWGGDEVHVIDVAKTAPVSTINAGAGYVRSAALHPSEQWIALGGEKAAVQLWHLPTSRLIKSWQIGPLAGVVTHVAFSPDGHYLATLNGNGTVYLLSLDGLLKP